MKRAIFEWLNNQIPVDIDFPTYTHPSALLITLHGLLGHRNSSKFIQIAERGIKSGFVVVRFDQTGAGENKQKKGSDLISARLECIERVVEFSKSVVRSHGFSYKLPLLIFGSSFGGYLAYIYSSKNPEVDGIVSWATPFSVEKVRKFLIEKFPFDFLKRVNDPLGYPDSLNNVDNIQNVKKALIIHGLEDETVPWFEAYRIYSTLALPKRLILIERADHRFGDFALREKAIDLTFKWFEECVQRKTLQAFHNW